MIAFDFVRPGFFARLAAALAVLALLVSCSGAVSGPSTTPNGGALVVSPAAATLYTDTPFTFVVTGGTGTYFIASSDQLALPVAGVLDGNVFTVVAGPVAADTPVTLTVRDTGTAAPVLVSATVKPRTVSNTVTVTPSASQSAACGASICAGGDAEVKVVLTLGGAPLANREVRFDVVSGDFRIITGSGGGESLAFSTTTFTDSSGTARVRIRALSDAEAQTGLLQITDVTAGSSTGTAISIAPSSNAPLSAQPSTIAFAGRDADSCASGITAEVIVFGGRPPYNISSPGTFIVTPSLLLQSGQRFQVQATGQCTEGSAIAVVDNNGNTVTVTASNVPGAVTQNPPPLVVSPTSVTLEACDTNATVAVAGGVQPYFATSSHQQVRALVFNRPGGGGTVTITRQKGVSSGPVTSPQTVVVSDGRTTGSVTVNIGPAALGPC